MHEAFAVDPVSETDRKMPLTGNPHPRQFRGRKEKRSRRDNLVLAAMDQENGREFGGRLRRDGLILLLRCDKLAGIAEDARGTRARRNPA